MTASTSDQPTTTAHASGYAPVNGLNLYYEIHGSGEPLVLLHGGFALTGSGVAGQLARFWIGAQREKHMCQMSSLHR